MGDVVLVYVGCSLVTAMALGLMAFFWVDRNYWLRSAGRFADHANTLAKELEATESIIRRVIEPDPELAVPMPPPTPAELRMAASELRAWSRQLADE